MSERERGRFKIDPSAGPGDQPEDIRAFRSALFDTRRAFPGDAEVEREVSYWLDRVEKWLSPDWYSCYLVVDEEAEQIEVRSSGTLPGGGHVDFEHTVHPGETFGPYTYDDYVELGSGWHDLPWKVDP